MIRWVVMMDTPRNRWTFRLLAFAGMGQRRTDGRQHAPTESGRGCILVRDRRRQSASSPVPEGCRTIGIVKASRVREGRTQGGLRRTPGSLRRDGRAVRDLDFAGGGRPFEDASFEPAGDVACHLRCSAIERSIRSRALRSLLRRSAEWNRFSVRGNSGRRHRGAREP